MSGARRWRALLITAFVVATVSLVFANIGDKAVPVDKSKAPIPTEAAAEGGVALTADGVTFASGACISFPPANGPAKGVVLLDAGHGGVDPGGTGRTSSGRRVHEKVATLGVVKAATERLRAAGYRVVVSRWTDTTIGVPRPGEVVDNLFTPLGARRDVLVRLACINASKAQVLVSVHTNAFGDPREGGALTIYDPDRTFAAANRRLATMLQSGVIAALRAAGSPVSDRSILKDTSNHGTALTAAGARYGHEIILGPYAKGYVSHPSHMPGAIMEPLFLTKPAEADIAMSPAGQALLANVITSVVQQFLG